MSFKHSKLPLTTTSILDSKSGKSSPNSNIAASKSGNISASILDCISRRSNELLTSLSIDLCWECPESDTMFHRDWIGLVKHNTSYPLDAPICRQTPITNLLPTAGMAGCGSRFSPWSANKNPTFLWFLAARALYSLARIMPTAFRVTWENSENAKARSFVQRSTKLLISQRLIAAELEDAHDAAKSLGDEAGFALTIQHDKNFTRMIQATVAHVSEDITIDLVLIFADAHPLQVPGVSLTNIHGIPRTRHHHWRLACLRALRGEETGGGMSIFDVLWVFCENMRFFYEGLEDCPICYSVVHLQSHSLPGKTCSTCKAKYHAECLFKWFRTSKKRKCPLCTSIF
eukprot:CAMPEP_0113853892 /NCGR_PEP_ID=MMETSP0372-20130328/6830_1 /TAXON_ID=340204 /ORGANISM="Lankesteria abbotti" /LENGTH=343 /DNA_ID=CAMNT_0000826627 /DNA_START=54 /DNA_END=1085 /DNA_ORIENTATION=- /assembly_acc=CAM_ASM_000359